MIKPIIAVDIDEVLALNAESFIAYTNQQWGMDLTIDDYHEHWAEIWKVDHDETIRRASEYNISGLHETMQHFEEAVAVLEALASKYKLIIVTARRQELAEKTERWIEARFSGIFSAVHYAGIWDTQRKDAVTFTKAGICLELGVNYLIDDQSKHCNAAQEAGIQAVMFGDYSWNRNDQLVDGVVRCADWIKVQEHFDGKA